MWYIYTMEYYTAEKNNDILNFAEKMDGARKHHFECGNPDTERQLSHVLAHRCFLNIKQRKPAYRSQSQRTKTTMRTLRETYMDLIYMGNRKKTRSPV